MDEKTRNLYKKGIYSKEQQKVIAEAKAYFKENDPEGLEIYESALKDGAEPVETFNLIKATW